MRRVILAAAAATVSFGMLAAPVFAQTQTAEATISSMSELGMNVEGLVLTEEQVLQIQAVLNDASQDDTEKVAAIEALLAH